MSTWPSAPAAMQKLADVHDTDVKTPPGTACNAQAVPSHTSAPPPAVRELAPTASQKLGETHDTPFKIMRTPLTDFTGFAVFWICQADPFHTSARATDALLELSGCEPTASQKLTEGQDPAASLLLVAAGGAT